jgi:hypothetical protein
MGNWTYEMPTQNGDTVYVSVHPMGGLHFSTRGHYGSRVFDPMDGKDTKLDIAICDECVINNVKRVRGTGFSHVHETALKENKEYIKEHNEKDEELLARIRQSLKDLFDGD